MIGEFDVGLFDVSSMLCLSMKEMLTPCREVTFVCNMFHVEAWGELEAKYFKSIIYFIYFCFLKFFFSDFCLSLQVRWNANEMNVGTCEFNCYILFCSRELKF